MAHFWEHGLSRPNVHMKYIYHNLSMVFQRKKDHLWTEEKEEDYDTTCNMSHIQHHPFTIIKPLTNNKKNSAVSFCPNMAAQSFFVWNFNGGHCNGHLLRLCVFNSEVKYCNWFSDQHPGLYSPTWLYAWTVETSFGGEVQQLLRSP